MKFRTAFEMNIGSKTRSLGQILETSSVHSRGYIFSPILIKLSQNVCLNEILEEFENGSCGSKTRSLDQGCNKTPCFPVL